MSSRSLLALAALAFTPLLLPATSAEAQQILGVSPALPTSTDEIRISVPRPGCSYTYAIAVQGDMIILNMNKSSLGCPPPRRPIPSSSQVVFVPPVPAGSYILTVMTDGHLTDSRPILVQAPSGNLSLLEGRFTVSVTWMAPQSTSAAAASAVQLGDGSGYFWFFDAEDVDLTIKMIGPLASDLSYWFFASSGTNMQFTITVTDTWLGRTVTYQNPAGLNQNFLDFTSFSYLH